MGQLTAALASALDVWLAVVVLLSLFTVAIFRPQQVQDGARFRKAIRYIGLYLVVPTVLALVSAMVDDSDVAQFFVSLAVLAGRVLLAMTVVVSLRALLPKI